ncbi:serine/threonine protein kinase [Catenuloplanes atrovinosus]|uniref:Serine/threonine protein kinase n=1 Tax=Catenuloplanes atrovinosus TaxID=137266 RepID=A0AAE4C9Q7_9ACTN|nr:protein kinase [Catenuloplanes atrovinosus]MDR7276806.1 serine/threonine protein kinase [Catenuloplanes atrovinosus]
MPPERASHPNGQSIPLRPGDPRRLGVYELFSRLGQGGMGTIYLGRAPDGRAVAVKVIRPELAGQEEFLARFRREVERARQVPPFCTAAVLDADPDHSTPYLVVEYVQGPNLAGVVRERGPLTGGDLHGVAIGVATALSAIHGAGVIHRDLKPSNVLFALGTPKVIDFGIARAVEATSSLTRSDQVVGTVAYMAPERFDGKGRAIGPAADVFAWGAVVTYAATGRTPFHADAAGVIAARILTQEPDLDGLPASLRGIVARSLAKEPAARPTAPELVDLLLNTGTPAAAGLAERPELREAAEAVRAPLRRPFRTPRRAPRPKPKPAPRATAAPEASPPPKAAPKPEPAPPTRRRRQGRSVEGVLAAVSVLLIAGAAAALTVARPEARNPAAPPPAAPAPATGSPRPAPDRAEPGRPLPPRLPVTTGRPVIRVADGTAVPVGPFFVRNLGSGTCTDLERSAGGDRDRPVQHHECSPAVEDNQEWLFVPRAVDEDGYHGYWIQNIDDGFCIDPPGAAAVEAGTALVEMDCAVGDNQHFRLEPRSVAGGVPYYRLRNVVSDLCVTLPAGGGVQLVLVPCDTADEQKWALIYKPDL